MILKIMRSALIAAALFYIGTVTYFFLIQKSLVYFPSSEIWMTPDMMGLDYEEVFINTADGERIAAWYLPKKDSRGTLLFFHGNAGNISHRLDSLRIFNELGLNTLIIDYRGYGASSGSPSEKGLYMDAVAAYEYLVDEKEISPDRLMIFGRSLGGGVASYLASVKLPAAGMILESVFISMPELGREIYPFIPVRLIARERFSVLENINNSEIPLLVVHSPDDEIIPFSHGKKIYENSSSEIKEFLKIRGSHNEGFFRSMDIYMKGLDNFLNTILEDDLTEN